MFRSEKNRVHSLFLSHTHLTRAIFSHSLPLTSVYMLRNVYLPHSIAEPIRSDIFSEWVDDADEFGRIFDI